MRERLVAAAVLLLFGCQCGARARDSAARATAPSNVIDASEIVRATGTAAPYVDPPPKDEREQDREPVSGGTLERTPEPPASSVDDPPIPTTGPFAEKAPDEERAAPLDLPDAGSAPLEDAGDPLPDPDAHGR